MPFIQTVCGIGLLALIASAPFSAHAETCSASQRADLAKAGYQKAEIENMCSAAAPAGSSAPSKPAASTSAKAASPKPEPKTAADTAAGNAQVLKEKTEAAAQAFKAHDYINAAHLFSEVVAINPNDALAWHFLGQSLENNGDVKAGRAAYRQSLIISPSGEVAQRNRLFLDKVSFDVQYAAKFIGENAQISGISADGLVVVGTNGAGHAIKWSEKEGLKDLGTMGGKRTIAQTCSADGQIVFGTFRDDGGQPHIFRWSATDGAQDLGALDRKYMGKFNVSQDSSTVISDFQNEDGISHIFRWTASGGLQNLGVVGGSNVFLLGTSADGSTIVGIRTDAHGDQHAFRWTAAGGVKELVTVRGAQKAVAESVSRDGSFVAGSFQDAEFHMFPARWNQSGGLENLGALGQFTSGSDISADGNVIAGYYLDPENKWHVFRWTPTGGKQDIGPLNTTQNSSPTVRTSADGSTIAGTFYDDSMNSHFFWWTQSKGLVDAGTLGGKSVSIKAFSADFSAMVALIEDAQGNYHTAVARLAE